MNHKRPPERLDDLVGEIADIASEAVGLIPVVGTVLKAARLGRSIPDRLFMQKSRKFFEEVDKASKEEVDLFFIELQQEGKLTHFGNNILFLIDRMDDLEKPVIIGRLFRAAIEKKIQLENAKRIAALISGVYSADLRALPEFKGGSKGGNADIASSLASAGFLKVIAEDWNSTATYDLNQYGLQLLEFGLTG